MKGRVIIRTMPYGSIQVREWQPGNRIELESKGCGFSFHVLAGCWGLPPGLGLAALSFATPYPWLLSPLALFIACGIPFYADWLFYRRRLVTFDWSTNRVQWTLGRTTGSAPLSEVESFEFHGLHIRSSCSVGVPRIRTSEYSGLLSMRVNGRRILLGNSTEFIRDECSPYSELLTLKTMLTAELGLTKGHEEKFHGGSIGWALRRPLFPWFSWQTAAT